MKIVVLLLLISVAVTAMFLGAGAGQANPASAGAPQWTPARGDVVNVYREVGAAGSSKMETKLADELFGYEVYRAPPDSWLTVVGVSAVCKDDCWWVEVDRFKGGTKMLPKEEWISQVKGFVRGWKWTSTSPAWSRGDQVPFGPTAGAASVGWTIAPGHQLVLLPCDTASLIEGVSILGYLSRN